MLLPDLSRLTLATGAPKKDRDGNDFPAEHILPSYQAELTRWVGNGWAYFSNDGYKWTLDFRIKTFSSENELTATEFPGIDDRYEKLQQAIQQPPLSFVGAREEFSSRSLDLPQWLSDAIDRRVDHIEGLLLGFVASFHSPLRVDRSDNGTIHLSCFYSWAALRPEIIDLLVSRKYWFEVIQAGEDQDLDVYERIPGGPVPLPDAFLQAVDAREAAKLRDLQARAAAAERARREAEARQEVADSASGGQQTIAQREEASAQQKRQNSVRRKALFARAEQEGLVSITDAEKRWFTETYDQEIGDALSKFVLKQHGGRVAFILSHLPQVADGSVELQAWQFAKVARVVLESVLRMANAVVEAFEADGRNPVSYAQTRSGQISNTLVLPSPIGDVKLYVRTTPSAAKEAVKIHNPSKFAAITWSVTFEKYSRARQAANEGLEAEGYGGAGRDDEDDAFAGAQIQVRSVATLNAALNGIWTVLMQSQERQARAVRWSLQALRVAEIGAARLVTPKARPSAAPSTSKPQLDADGWAGRRQE